MTARALPFVAALLLGSALAAPVLAGQTASTPTTDDGGDALLAGFRDPPNSARPRTWWHWLNGNITEDGIAKDLAWMKQVGLGGVQMFDADLMTPPVVKDRLAYMTPAWRHALRTAAGIADREGLELGIASSPGWSETGGPWVAPADAMKKLVWSETDVAGGRRFAGRLAPPPSVTGPFAALPMPPSIEEILGVAKPAPKPTAYGDVAVLAYPVDAATAARPVTGAPSASVAGKPVDAAALLSGDPATALKVAPGEAVTLAWPAAQTMRSATMFLPGAKSMFTPATVKPRLEASDDGRQWRAVADLDVTEVPTTIAFRPVTARYFRLLLVPGGGAGANMSAPAPGAVAPDLFGRGSGPPSVTVGAFAVSPAARIDRFEQKAGFAVARDYLALPTTAAAGDAGAAPARVVDLTARMRPDGSLDWTPPPGRWRVVRFGWSLLGTTNHPASPDATGLEVDKFDGAAVRRYLDHYLGTYRQAAGADLIGDHGVRALVTDSIEVGAANWTPRLIAQFRRLRGYDPTPWLPTLTGAVIGTRAQSDAFLYDYRRTLADLLASEHYGTVAAVAHDHDLTVYGEALEDHRPSLGDDLAMRRHADVPMAAMWAFPRGGVPNPSYVADIRGAASVAHLYGQNLVAAESMTAALSPWAFAPSDLRHVIDTEFALGVNRPVIHTSVHVPVDDKQPGLSLFIFGQYFNRMESWAGMARPWVDYIARSSFLLQQGRNVADVAYFTGEEAPLTSLYGDAPVADAPVGHGYDFVDAAALSGVLRVDGGDLVAASGARYRLLYLGGSSRRMTLPTLRRIAELAEGGATIVGDAPTGSPALGEDTPAYRALVARLWSGAAVTAVGRGRVIAGRDVAAALARAGVPADLDAGGATDDLLPFVHRHWDGGDLYFLANRDNRPLHVEARFRVAGRVPELWHADTGRTEPVSYRITGGTTLVPLDLSAEESVFVVFRRPATTTAATIAPASLAPVATLDGAWQVAFQANRGAPAAATLPVLAPLSANAVPGIRYFSGVATYRRDFTVPGKTRPGAPLWLDLGAVGDVAEVSVNGRPVGTVWHAPWRVDIGGAVHSGTNRLEVRVADLWVNRLIGDAQPGTTAKVTWTAMPTYRADAPLRPSGLIGPVRLLRPAR